MTHQFFKKTVAFSLLGHLAMFGILSFSFGNRLPKLDYTNVSFWGGILKKYDFIYHDNSLKLNQQKIFTQPKIMNLPSEKNNTQDYFLKSYYLKPCVRLAVENEKRVFTQNLLETPIPEKRGESVVMFYPALPLHFSLYFKDRQVVHIVLEYNVISEGKINSLAIRRKISSGNLEVDLLCLRYLSHYLAVRQDRAVSDDWQMIKIELRPLR